MLLTGKWISGKSLVVVKGSGRHVAFQSASTNTHRPMNNHRNVHLPLCNNMLVDGADGADGKRAGLHVRAAGRVMCLVHSMA